MDDLPRVLFVASFPPPLTGQTVATQAFHSMATGFGTVDRLDFSDPGRHERPSGAFSWGQLGRVMGVAKAILRGPRYDIAYLTVASSTIGRLRDVVLLRALGRRAERIVVHVHQGSFGTATEGVAGSLSRATLKARVHRFIFLAPRLARAAPWIPTDRVRIVPNPPGEGVTPSAEEVEEAIHRRASRAGPVRLLFLANMLPGKGHQRLLEALPGVCSGLSDGRRLHVDFAGAWSSAEARSEFERRIHELGLDDVAHVHGSIGNRARILDLLKGAHALVFPTTYDLEGAPLAVIEALGTGTPVVATRHAALPDLIEDGQSGRLLACSATTSELAEAILHLVTDPDWRATAEAARRAYEERFAVAVVERAFRDALLS